MLPMLVGRNTNETKKGRSYKRPLTGISSTKHHGNSDVSDRHLPVTLRRDSDGTSQAPLLASVSSTLPRNAPLPHIVNLADSIERFNVVPYSEIERTHPRCITATSEGFKSASAHRDPHIQEWTCDAGEMREGLQFKRSYSSS